MAKKLQPDSKPSEGFVAPPGPVSREEQCLNLEKNGFVETPEIRPGVFRVYEKVADGKREYIEVL